MLTRDMLVRSLTFLRDVLVAGWLASGGWDLRAEAALPPRSLAAQPPRGDHPRGHRRADRGGQHVQATHQQALAADLRVAKTPPLLLIPEDPLLLRVDSNERVAADVWLAGRRPGAARGAGADPAVVLLLECQHDLRQLVRNTAGRTGVDRGVGVDDRCLPGQRIFRDLEQVEQLPVGVVGARGAR